MSISHYSYKYGHGSKEFSLESDRVIKEVTVAKMPLLEDVKAAILDAVYHPIGSAPINELVKPGQKIAFVGSLSATIRHVWPTVLSLCPFWSTK